MLNARTVRSPHGRLVHLDYRGDDNRPGPTRSTACGRTVTQTWTVEHDTLATAAGQVTCARCAEWARYHHVSQLVAASGATDMARILLATEAANSTDRYRQLVAEHTTADDAPPVHGPGTAERLAVVHPSCAGLLDRGRTAILRAETLQRSARLDAAVRALPPGGTLHA